MDSFWTLYRLLTQNPLPRHILLKSLSLQHNSLIDFYQQINIFADLIL